MRWVAAWLGVACLGLLPVSPLSGQELKLRSTFNRAGGPDGVLSVALSSDGKMLAGCLGKAIKLWDVATGKELATLKGHTSLVRSVAFSPDGKTLASGSGDFESPFAGHDPPGQIKLWDVATGRNIANLTGHAKLVFSVAYSPDGKTLASGSYDQTIKLWDFASGKEKATLKGHDLSISPLAFSPDGKTLASGSEDYTIKLWDLASGKEKATLKGHDKPVRSLAFSPNGNALAEGSYDSAVRLWDVKSGRSTATPFTGWQVLSVAFSPDGKMLASGNGDGTIKLWDVPAGEKTDK
jgi:WD40 repeat protein